MSSNIQEVRPRGRIDAMFALGEHPVLEKEVAEGALSLSTISQVQSHVRKHDVPKDERLDLFRQMAGKSSVRWKLFLSLQER